MAEPVLKVTLVRPRGVQKSRISNAAEEPVGIYSRAEPSAQFDAGTRVKGKRARAVCNTFFFSLSP